MPRKSLRQANYTPPPDTAPALAQYMKTASPSALGEIALNRENQVANLWKEMREIIEELMQKHSEANLARFILETRKLDPPIKTISPTEEMLNEAIERAPRLLSAGRKANNA